MVSLGLNGYGEYLQPGRVSDCYLGILLDQPSPENPARARRQAQVVCLGLLPSGHQRIILLQPARRTVRHVAPRPTTNGR